eukprot:CAMPEP_0117441052 /NCGR_PEP_ID=MMETSP0759-20121206/3421_1 /TAXON_ID=63605 /ORGANISM="Percolomonas cosmopolitus, Strain WS" /LENGTH=449 /DNA_ID=CAMNT_0005232865 /DNA_START=169 /DNA_END=1518 /DNA_ORIENTATION=+
MSSRIIDLTLSDDEVDNVPVLRGQHTQSPKSPQYSPQTPTTTVPPSSGRLNGIESQHHTQLPHFSEITSPLRFPLASAAVHNRSDARGAQHQRRFQPNKTRNGHDNLFQPWHQRTSNHPHNNHDAHHHRTRDDDFFSDFFNEESGANLADSGDSLDFLDEFAPTRDDTATASNTTTTTTTSPSDTPSSTIRTRRRRIFRSPTPAGNVSTIDLVSSPSHLPSTTTATTTSSAASEDDGVLTNVFGASPKRKRKRSPSPAKEGNDEEKCAICFDDITNKTTLDACTHIFCWECIHQWSVKSNVCPLCRERFHSLKKKDHSGRKAKRIEVPHRDFRPAEQPLRFEDLQNILGAGVQELQRMVFFRNVMGEQQRHAPGGAFHGHRRQPAYRIPPQFPENMLAFAANHWAMGRGLDGVHRFGGNPVRVRVRVRGRSNTTTNGGPAPVIDLTGDE